MAAGFEGASPMCWGQAGTHCTGCMSLVPCSTAPLFNHTVAGELVNVGTGECVELAKSSKASDTGVLGSWSCGSGQPNQRWSVDSVTGQIGSVGVVRAVWD